MGNSTNGYNAQPIAFVRSPYTRRIDAPHQSTVVEGTETGAVAEASIEFVPDIEFAAFRDLAGFERIWLLFVFHRSEGWKAEVRPPRG
ncbi:MAG: TrmO family methyltransferase, partial [Dokdonella sp.]